VDLVVTMEPKDLIMSPDKKEMVKRMLDKGLPPNEVADLAQVPMEQVQQILAPGMAKDDSDDDDDDKDDDDDEDVESKFQNDGPATLPAVQEESVSSEQASGHQPRRGIGYDVEPAATATAATSKGIGYDVEPTATATAATSKGKGKGKGKGDRRQAGGDDDSGGGGALHVQQKAMPSAFELENMSPAEKRAARKAAAPPSQDLTLQLRDLMSGAFPGLSRHQMADEVARIVEAKGDVNTTDETDGGGGQTVLMFAVQHAANPDVVQRLLNCKANPRQENSAGFTAMHTCATRAMPDSAVPEIVRMLVDQRCDPSLAAGPQGLTPLHVAAQWKNLDFCRVLMDVGADATVKSVGGATALEWGASKKLSANETFTLHAILSR